ncbi:hypothetical protein DSM104329_01958 [Capillimicrobium parvum]|uniref:glycerophosphodiester phosphodiesterase n=1 Tax=Capillimicrobium parvum TaxID=2884022 RepID=A0A9E7BZN4_9ACTN|nr:glycerophosphodiester phosphodiesterase [Capillimicrobium parvum]UGS35565.1 hypothetical protein DSM104329_01958 [Capillimicrobium parvum]
MIGHRGASGYRPEHTLASYRLAAEQGADYVEPDLVSTRDGVLVARHENEIGGTTDVAQHPEFAGRRATKVVDGVRITGWFTEDFTLAELKTLRAKERIPQIRPANAAYDGQFEVPTFQEVLDLRKQLSKELGREIGVYPETKHPSYFRAIGLPLEPPLVQALTRNGLNRPNAPVFVQSFETGNLRALDRELKVPLVQLLGAPDDHPAGDPRVYRDLAAPAGLASIARYADGVGPSKDYDVPRNADGSSGTPTSFVADAHAAGLQVHPYTFRRENTFLPLELRSSPDPAGIGDLEAEIRRFVSIGVDGFFTDDPDIGVAARRTTLAVIGDTPYGDVEVGAVHIAGSDDDRAPWFGDRRDAAGQPRPETPQERALREHEVATRQANNLAWIDRIFAEARRSRAAGVAIALQADMWDPSAGDLSGFDAYKERLAKRAHAFGKPVLLLNGDSHVYTSEQPLAGVPNVSRITVNGSTTCPHEYLRLSIDPRSPAVFAHERVPLPSTAQLCGA